MKPSASRQTQVGDGERLSSLYSLSDTSRSLSSSACAARCAMLTRRRNENSAPFCAGATTRAPDGGAAAPAERDQVSLRRALWVCAARTELAPPRFVTKARCNQLAHSARQHGRDVRRAAHGSHQEPHAARRCRNSCGDNGPICTRRRQSHVPPPNSILFPP